jgi:hypothetical protein
VLEKGSTASGERSSPSHFMSVPKPAPESDFPAREEERVAPIVNLPVNALTDGGDPTKEIRTLIEQLHRSARDTRAQLETVQREKEKVSRQLDTAMEELGTARNREAELRSRFVEITFRNQRAR